MLNPHITIKNFVLTTFCATFTLSYSCQGVDQQILPSRESFISEQALAEKIKNVILCVEHEAKQDPLLLQAGLNSVFAREDLTNGHAWAVAALVLLSGTLYDYFVTQLPDATPRESLCNYFHSQNNQVSCSGFFDWYGTLSLTFFIQLIARSHQLLKNMETEEILKVQPQSWDDLLLPLFAYFCSRYTLRATGVISETTDSLIVAPLAAVLLLTYIREQRFTQALATITHEPQEHSLKKE